MHCSGIIGMMADYLQLKCVHSFKLMLRISTETETKKCGGNNRHHCALWACDT